MLKTLTHAFTTHTNTQVADFGLSVKMDHMETHLSNTFQGTMSHMAPEILVKGYLSKAADVYAVSNSEGGAIYIGRGGRCEPHGA